MNTPPIVCLCGSTRFANEFMAEQFRLTVEGWIVLSVGCFPRKPDGTWDKMQITDEQKVKLDALHFKKIELAERVHIINVGGYIGESTRNEIRHAMRERKQITFLEPYQAEHQQEHTEVMRAICGEDWHP
jgi:hypothetical protein